MGDSGEVGPIEADKLPAEVRQEPLRLPEGFAWESMDLQQPAVLDELYQLLNLNYVEDDDNMFRFDYSREFLQWALLVPGFKASWHCGVRATKSGKLMGFISAIPAEMALGCAAIGHRREQHLVEINFLCVHKKLRAKRLAPVLIEEITRRVHVEGIFQAVYTAGVVLPRPVASCQYFHRTLEAQRLVEARFTRPPRDMLMRDFIKKYALPAAPAVPGLRPLTPADVPAARTLLLAYLERFVLAPRFSEAEFAHWFLPRSGVISSFVVEDPESHALTDLCSFYTLPSTVCV